MDIVETTRTVSLHLSQFLLLLLWTFFFLLFNVVPQSLLRFLFLLLRFTFIKHPPGCYHFETFHLVLWLFLLISIVFLSFSALSPSVYCGSVLGLIFLCYTLPLGSIINSHSLLLYISLYLKIPICIPDLSWALNQCFKCKLRYIKVFQNLSKICSCRVASM